MCFNYWFIMREEEGHRSPTLQTSNWQPYLFLHISTTISPCNFTSPSLLHFYYWVCIPLTNWNYLNQQPHLCRDNPTDCCWQELKDYYSCYIIENASPAFRAYLASLHETRSIQTTDSPPSASQPVFRYRCYQVFCKQRLQTCIHCAITRCVHVCIHVYAFVNTKYTKCKHVCRNVYMLMIPQYPISHKFKCPSPLLKSLTKKLLNQPSCKNLIYKYFIN